MNHIYSQLFSQVFLRGHEDCSFFGGWREKVRPKTSLTAAGELWFPAEGIFLTSCGCKSEASVMEQSTTTSQETLTHTRHNKTAQNTETSWIKRLQKTAITIQNEPEHSKKNKNKKTKWERCLNNHHTKTQITYYSNDKNKVLIPQQSHTQHE